MSIATLDGYAFPFNPNSVSWGYKLNVSSTETLGGRVVQILSARIESLDWQGHAGSRAALLALFERVGQIMEKHISSERPVRLVVPSKRWVLDVFVKSMPAVGWDIRAVSYPYKLSFEVDEDFGTVSRTVISKELKRLAEGIGYDPSWHGGQVMGTTQDFLDPIDAIQSDILHILGADTGIRTGIRVGEEGEVEQ
jgi:hypothetical protein